MKLNHKKSLLLLSFILLYFAIGATNPIATFDSANTAYSKKEYIKAIELYELIVKSKQQSPELYFNLGNAYFQSGNYVNAILNYERAKKFAPNDEEILTNLSFANKKTEDKIEAAPVMFLIELKSKLISLFSETAWSILCIVFFIVGLMLLTLFMVSHKTSLKKGTFYGGVCCFFIFIITFLLAKWSYDESKNHNEAIITDATVTILSSPSDTSTKLFILHKGTKVEIKEETDGWLEIKIANGNIGWIKNNQLERI